MKLTKTTIDITILLLIVLLYNFFDKIFRYIFFGISTNAPVKILSFLGLKFKESSGQYNSIILFEVFNGNLLTFTCSIIFGIVVLILKRYPETSLPYRRFDIIVKATVIMLTTYYALNMLNVHFGFFRILDVLTLLILAFLGIRRWYYLLLWTPFLYACMGEFNYPMGGFSFTDKQMPLLLVNLFIAVAILNCLVIITNTSWSNKISQRIIELEGVLLLSGLASCYFVPFLSKLVLGPNLFSWPFVEDFGLSFLHYSARGWITDEYWLNFIKEVLDNYGHFFLLIALIIEGLVVLLFTGRRVREQLFYSVIILHLSIFFLSGIFFWKWIVIDIVIIYVLNKYPLYLSTRAKLYSFILLFSSYWVFNVSHLAWYTTPHYSQYRIQVQTENGSRKNVVLHEMSPYDLYFSFARFDLVQADELFPSYVSGYNDLIFANGIRYYDKNRGRTDISDIESIDGFKRFLSEYFSKVNTNLERSRYIKSINILPKHVYYYPKLPHYSWDEKVTHIYVYRDSGDLTISREIESDLVLKISL